MHRSENGPLPSREQAEHRRAFFSDLTGAGSQLRRLPLVDGPLYPVSTPPGVEPAEVTPERQESSPQPLCTLARRHSAPEPIYEGQPAAGCFVGMTSAGRAVGQRAPSRLPAGDLGFGLAGWRGRGDASRDGLRDCAVPGRPGQVGPREGWPLGRRTPCTALRYYCGSVAFREARLVSAEFFLVV